MRVGAVERWRTVGAALLGGAMWSVSAPTVLFADFRKAYHPAGAAAWGGPEPLAQLYEAVHFTNVPAVAWFFAPLGRLPVQPAAWLFLAIGIVGSLLAALLLARGSTRPNANWLLLAMFLVNGPLIYSLREGNSSHLVLLALVASLLLLHAGHPLVAGVLIGLIAMIKLPLLVLIPYLAARRHWTAMTAALAVVGAMLTISVLTFSFEMLRSWYHCCVEPFSSEPVAAYNAQTIHAFVARLTTGAAHLDNFRPVAPSTTLTIVRYASTALLAGTLALAAIVRRSRSNDLLTFAIVLTMALVVSPLAWSHYYCLLLIPFGLYHAGHLDLPRDAFTRRIMLISLALCSAPVLHPDRAVFDGPIASRSLVSVCLIGAILLLAVLLRAAVTQRKPVEVAPMPSPLAAT